MERPEIAELKFVKCSECGYTEPYRSRARSFMEAGALGVGSGPIYGPFPGGVCTEDWRIDPLLKCRCRLLSDVALAEQKYQEMREFARELGDALGNMAAPEEDIAPRITELMHRYVKEFPVDFLYDEEE